MVEFICYSFYADGLIIIFYDIEHEKETEQRLKKSIVNYHSLVENVPDVITQWNKELKLIYANLAFGEKAGSEQRRAYMVRTAAKWDSLMKLLFRI